MTEIGQGLPAGSDLVPGWLVRLAAIGWRLLATILLGLVLLAIALELATVTASILLAAIVSRVRGTPSHETYRDSGPTSERPDPRPSGGRKRS
jgi:hypothetical protein